MWTIALTSLLYLAYVAPALSSPLNRPTVSRLDTLPLDLTNDTLLATLHAGEQKPEAPYTWPVPGEKHTFVKFERYGANVPDPNGYLFMYVNALPLLAFSDLGLTLARSRLRLQQALNGVIRQEGKDARLSGHQSWEWEHCKLEVRMIETVKVRDLLSWIVGFWRFMKRYGYVEADLRFQTDFVYWRDHATAKFAISGVATATTLLHKLTLQIHQQGSEFKARPYFPFEIENLVFRLIPWQRGSIQLGDLKTWVLGMKEFMGQYGWREVDMQVLGIPNARIDPDPYGGGLCDTGTLRMEELEGGD
ncbi:MAG: hypothetical protein Q9170_003123 [Blastenia crenularia]